MTSRPIDYFNLLSIIDSPVAKNWMAYAIRYCSGYQFNVGGKIFSTFVSTLTKKIKKTNSDEFYDCHLLASNFNLIYLLRTKYIF